MVLKTLELRVVDFTHPYYKNFDYSEPDYYSELPVLIEGYGQNQKSPSNLSVIVEKWQKWDRIPEKRSIHHFDPVLFWFWVLDRKNNVYLIPQEPVSFFIDFNVETGALKDLEERKGSAFDKKVILNKGEEELVCKYNPFFIRDHQGYVFKWIKNEKHFNLTGNTAKKFNSHVTFTYQLLEKIKSTLEYKKNNSPLSYSKKEEFQYFIDGLKKILNSDYPSKLYIIP